MAMANDGSFMEMFKKKQEVEKRLAETKEREAAQSTGKPGMSAAVAKFAANVSRTGSKISFGLKGQTKKRPVAGFDGSQDAGGSADDVPDEVLRLAKRPALSSAHRQNGGSSAAAAAATAQRLSKFEAANSNARAQRRSKWDSDAKGQAIQQVAVPVRAPAPSSVEQQGVCDQLASFVAKNGEDFEEMTRERNKDTPLFQFLFDPTNKDYIYYRWKIDQERPKAPPVTVEQAVLSGLQAVRKEEWALPEANNQYDNDEEEEFVADPVLREKFRREKEIDKRKTEKQGGGMNDFLPQNEMEKYHHAAMVAMGKAKKEDFVPAAEKNAITQSNIGHKMLSKMGWSEGQGVGASGDGRVQPVVAAPVKMDNAGVGEDGIGTTHVLKGDEDPFEIYKKRMMLSYKHRPNPLGNPRKQYY